MAQIYLCKTQDDRNDLFRDSERPRHHPRDRSIRLAKPKTPDMGTQKNNHVSYSYYVTSMLAFRIDRARMASW